WWAHREGVSARHLWITVAVCAMLLELAIIFLAARRRPNWIEMARRIELENPELRGALLAALEMRADAPSGLGYLESRVVQTAVDQAGEHDWIAGRLRRELRRRGWGAMGAVLVFAASLILTSIAWQHRGRAGVSKTAPPAPASTAIQVVVTPGDVEAERG